MAVKELPQQVGDAKSLRRDFRQVAADQKFLNARWDELVQTHAGEWVAVYQQEMIFATQLRDLLERAAAKGWHLGTMVVENLTSERRRVLLPTW